MTDRICIALRTIDVPYPICESHDARPAAKKNPSTPTGAPGPNQPTKKGSYPPIHTGATDPRHGRSTQPPGGTHSGPRSRAGLLAYGFRINEPTGSPFQPSGCAFSACLASRLSDTRSTPMAYCSRPFPITAAGPRWIHTTFPLAPSGRGTRDRLVTDCHFARRWKLRTKHEHPTPSRLTCKVRQVQSTAQANLRDTYLV